MHPSRIRGFKMRKMTFSVLLFAIAILFNACATQRAQPPPRPASQIVNFNSDPQGARVIMNGQPIGTTPFAFPVPLTYHTASAPIRARDIEPFNQRTAEMNQIRFIFLKDGYAQGEEVFRPVVSYFFDGRQADINFTFPAGVFHILQPQLVAQPTPTAVSRTAPGATSLERTVIRWRFDSDPRGARISWRVISSVPEEVRNTNETFLSTTPFEETRGFDILGLTYENAHNVTIEIRVERRGFFEQVRRFNVRQAIDQREISGFFELVPMD